MKPNPLSAAIDGGVPLVVLAPHLDDAVLSCGAMMLHARGHTAVTVATIFTEAGPPPYTLSARRYLHQVGARDASSLYRERRAEDRAALEPMGITCIHAGLIDALFRRRARPASWSRWARLLPEIAHVYPIYRLHTLSGRIAPADAGTLDAASEIIRRLVCPGPNLVLAPLGVGGHVDHVLVRTAAERSHAQLVYYSDFPHNQHRSADDDFIRRNGLVEAQWSQLPEAKAELIQAYPSQAHAMFPSGQIPLVPEIFFFPSGPSGIPCGEER